MISLNPLSEYLIKTDANHVILYILYKIYLFRIYVPAVKARNE